LRPVSGAPLLVELVRSLGHVENGGLPGNAATSALEGLPNIGTTQLNSPLPCF
jgi:hypothetical protein